MRRLFDFLYNHLTTLVFIALETLAVVLLCNRNVFSRTVVARHALTVQAHFEQVGTVIGDYFSLNQTNRRLADENALLHERIAVYQAMVDNMACDSVVGRKTPSRFSYTAARIVYASLSGSNNYVIIDRGSADGIAENMGVVADGCAYGVVGTVATHYSTVLLLINTSVNISAKVGNNEQIGVIGWDGDDRECVTLDELPSHIQVTPGDSIKTSAFSTIFPEDIYIGKVSLRKSKEVEGFSHIYVNVGARYDKVRYVAVIRNVELPQYEGLIDQMKGVEAVAEKTNPI